MGKHYRNMNAEELRELVFAMGWAALDLAQHLHFTTHCLKPEFQGDAYERACVMAYELADMPFNFEPTPPKQCQIAIFGENGLIRHDCNPRNLIKKEDSHEKSRRRSSD